MTRLQIGFQKGNGLIPTIIQDYLTGDVLMLGYMNREALQKTIRDKLVYFWSRSRQRLWMKGEKSGNQLKVKEIYVDCDKDTLLIKAELIGTNACHKGFRSCFHEKLSWLLMNYLKLLKTGKIDCRKIPMWLLF